MNGVLHALFGQITAYHFFALAFLLFLIGIFGVITRRNLIAVLMSVEVMLNAAALNFVAISAYTDGQLLQGHLVTLFIIAIAAAEVAVGLAIFINVFRSRGTVNPEKLTELNS
ncbi:MAG TPA: NADH-quinone oxidoreductase subunit NuoK [Deinococcales bacterium]|nr:NADH-quinone oxidoreductase subunit NuoK [Deinococcales bacterium]